jgi:hypothetical protein
MASAPAFNRSNAFIKNGRIQNTTISMNAKVITSHGTPLNTLDVVNKSYCDNNVGTITPVSAFVLIGNNWTTVLGSLSGDVSLSVFSEVMNGPCGSFMMTKNSPGRHPSIVRTTSVAGSTTNERLEIRWRLNMAIEIRKNGQNYDGPYRLKYILN